MWTAREAVQGRKGIEMGRESWTQGGKECKTCGVRVAEIRFRVKMTNVEIRMSNQ